MSERDSGRTCQTCGAPAADDAVVCLECSSVLRPAGSRPPTPPTPPAPNGPATGPATGGGPLAGIPGRTPGAPPGFAGASPNVVNVPPVPPVPPVGGTPPRPSSPAPKQPASSGKRLLVICGVGAVLALGLFAVMTFVSKDDGTETTAEVEADEDDETTTTGAPTPTTPRNQVERNLDGYCASPTAWDEVPAHDPAAVSTIYLSPDGSGLNENGVTSGDGNGADESVAGEIGPRSASTVISPAPDGVEQYIGDGVEPARTIACIDFVELRGTGERCAYSGSGPTNMFDESTHELATSTWTVAVYELHSGKQLTGGELTSRATPCPQAISVATPDEQVHYSLTNQEIIDWLGTKFPNGVPQP